MNRTAGLFGRDDDRALSDMHATARRSSTPRNPGFLSTPSIDFYPADAMAEGVSDEITRTCRCDTDHTAA